MAIVNPLPYPIQNGQAIDANPVMANFNQIVANVNANAAPAAGNPAQTFEVADATANSEAINLGQLENASINVNLSGLAVTRNITSLPANYDANQVVLLEAANANSSFTWNSGDPRILTAGLGPNGPYIRTATKPLDLTDSAGVLVPTAAASDQAVNLGQLGNYNQVIADFATGTLPSTCWGGAVQVRSNATVTLPTTNPPAGSKVVLYGNSGSFSVVSNSNQFIWSPALGLTSVTGPTTLNVPDGGWIEITSRGDGEYDVTGGSPLVFQNTAPAFTNPVVLPSYTVATLPASAPVGARAFVTDAMAPSWNQVLTGGGTTKCGALFNGSAWVAG